VTDSHVPQDGTTVDDLGNTVMTALGLAATGRRTDAAALLAPSVETLGSSRRPADPALIDASTLYATLTTGPEQLRAAYYAYRASHRVYPCGHPRRLAAADAYGAALHQHGRFGDAVIVRRHLLAGYRVHQPQAAPAAAASLAASLHATGRCTEALITVSGAWNIWRRHPYGDLSTGATILRAVIRMLRSCSRDFDIIALISQARDTPAWDNLVITHTTAAAYADTFYIDAHRGTVCTRTPQPRTRPSPVPAHSPRPPSPPRSAARSPADAWTPADPQGRDSRRPHPPTGPRAGETPTARSRSFTALADVLLHPTGTQPAGATPIRQVITPAAASVAGRPGWRTALRLAAVVLPALALVLHLTT
jgi:hypothetical protein